MKHIAFLGFLLIGATLTGVSLYMENSHATENTRTCFFAKGMLAYAEGFAWVDDAGNVRNAPYEKLKGDVEACAAIGEIL